MTQHTISTAHLSIERIQEIISNQLTLSLSEEATEKIIRCREYIDNRMAASTDPVYGINTGFGSLCDVKINNADLEQLQKNLVMSHACGTGEEVPHSIIKIMLLLKVQSLSYGHSGVQLQTVQRLIDFYNNDIYPVIYTKGSLGASGDLSPLAHLCLPLIGMGEVDYKGKRISGAELLKQFSWEEIHLQSKEGLALLNGTQFMSAYAVYCLIQSKRISAQSDFIAAISLDAFDGRIDAFNELIHIVRPHTGQLTTAKHMLEHLEGSEIAKQKKVQVQDPYSFRCIPQVHGASKDTISHVRHVVTTEINSVTDNPNVFPDEDLILSGGNFHGQPLALVMDFLAIALAELANISERRTYQLISGQRGLPAFLVENPGLNSGFMIPQYTAASIVSENKQLCTPASVDSIVSSNGQEDHVSMGANAATKLLRVVENVDRVFAIELMNAAQALEFRRPLRSSPSIEKYISEYRKVVSRNTEDRYLSADIQNSLEFIRA
ncbi:MAG: histidine ammonia-lyase [Sphingobacteriales bacterium]|nr:histidine ammonia-lyase [Sphingobacteriales bacterium]